MCPKCASTQIVVREDGFFENQMECKNCSHRFVALGSGIKTTGKITLGVAVFVFGMIFSGHLPDDPMAG
jgi:hypothetical protein